MKLTQNKLMEILHIRDKMYKHCVYSTTKYSTNQYKSPYNIIILLSSVISALQWFNMTVIAIKHHSN